MNSTDFHHGLIEHYRGEIIGEVLFDGLLAALAIARQRCVIGTIDSRLL